MAEQGVKALALGGRLAVVEQVASDVVVMAAP